MMQSSDAAAGVTFYWLRRGQWRDGLPPVEQALREPNGLLAAGGNLRPGCLIDAYRQGVFPWYSEDQSILWWSPDPRAVLFPDALKISRSLGRRIRNNEYRVSFDWAFPQVLRECAGWRENSSGTWITTEMAIAYEKLHALGVAHSVEAWHQNRLVGGLYGLAIGGVFFGESMFYRRVDASKVALVALVSRLREMGVELIDCQVGSPHLRSLGATDIPRNRFLALLRQLVDKPLIQRHWNNQHVV